MADDKTPAAITGVGLDLWHELHAALQFTVTEERIAVELCRTISLCEVLARELDVLGPVLDGQRGLKVNPIVAEIRQQRLAAARLAKSLDIPALDDRPNRRGGVRGVYGVK